MIPRQTYSRAFIFSSSHTPRTRSRHAFRAASRKPTRRAGRAKLRRATLPCLSQSGCGLDARSSRPAQSRPLIFDGQSLTFSPAPLSVEALPADVIQPAGHVVGAELLRAIE